MSEQSKPQASTELPDGKTCAECRHMPRCSWLIQQQPASRHCDWLPIRFVQREEKP